MGVPGIERPTESIEELNRALKHSYRKPMAEQDLSQYLAKDASAQTPARELHRPARIAEFKTRVAGGDAIERSVAWEQKPDPAKWAFCKEWLRLGGVVKNQAQLREWASLLYDAHSQSDARDVAREELSSAAS